MQLIAPVFQLRGDLLNAGDLFDLQHFGPRCHMTSQSCVWQFDDRIVGVVADVFAEFLEHLDGGADLSSRGSVHGRCWKNRLGLS